MDLGVWRKHHNIRAAAAVQSDDLPNPASHFQKPGRATSAVLGCGTPQLSLMLCTALLSSGWKTQGQQKTQRQQEPQGQKEPQGQQET